MQLLNTWVGGVLSVHSLFQYNVVHCNAYIMDIYILAYKTLMNVIVSFQKLA